MAASRSFLLQFSGSDVREDRIDELEEILACLFTRFFGGSSNTSSEDKTSAGKSEESIGVYGPIGGVSVARTAG